MGLSACMFLTFVAMIPLNLYVIGPAIAQHTLDNSEIVFERMVIGTVDASSTSFESTVEALLTNAGSISAEVASMTMHLYYQETLIGHVNMPQVNITGGKDASIVSNSTFFIDSQTAFKTFAADMVRKDEIQLHLKADVNLTAHMGVTITFRELKFDKIVKLTGLSGLKNLEILSSDPSVSDASNVKVAIMSKLNNPSVVEMTEMGDLHFELYYQGEHLGILESLDVHVVRGDNYLNMTGMIKPSHPQSPTVTAALSLLLSGQKVGITAIGSDINASTIPLFAPSFNGLSINADVIIPFKTLLTRCSIPHISMQLNPQQQNEVVMSMEAMVTIDSPLGPNCPINIKQVQLDATLLTIPAVVPIHIPSNGIITDLPASRRMGTTTTPTANVSDGSQATFSFSMVTAVALTDRGVFSQFCSDFVKDPQTNLVLQGQSSVSMQTPAGYVTAHSLPFQNIITIAALDSLKQVRLEMLKLYLIGGSREEGLLAQCQLKLNNPSVVSLDLGPSSDLYLDVYYKDVIIGYSKISQFVLNEGDNINIYPMIMQLAPSHPGLVEGVLSDFLCGKNTAVVVKGRKSVYPYLAEMLARLVLPTTVMGLNENLMPGSIMHGDVKAFLNGYIPTNLICVNPFNVTMEIVGYNTKIFRDGAQIGYATDSFPDNPIILTAHTNTTTRQIAIKYTISFQTVSAMFKSLVSHIILTMNGTLSVRIGTFEADVFYNAPRIDSKLELFGDSAVLSQ